MFAIDKHAKTNRNVSDDVPFGKEPSGKHSPCLNERLEISEP